MPRHCSPSMQWSMRSIRSRQRQKQRCRPNQLSASTSLALDIRRPREAALEVAIGHRHVVAGILLGCLPQRLEIPREVSAATPRLAHHEARLLAGENMCGNAWTIEGLLDLAAERL